MKLPQSVTVSVPATSANLGPGFDLLGIALDLRMRFHVHFDRDAGQSVRDASGKEIPSDKNYVKTAWDKAMTLRGTPAVPGFKATFQSDIPPGRGFGSSACALAAGTALASYALAETGHAPLSLQEELDLLSHLEGHPDNACPARLGGFVFSWMEGTTTRYLRKDLPASLALAAIVPNFSISTTQSRQKLPHTVPVPDALNNMKGVMLWLEYVHSGNAAYLTEALHTDRLHEPHRAASVPGFTELRKRLSDTECYGATLSGSGPGILVYYPAASHPAVLPTLTAIVKDLYPDGHVAVHACRPDASGILLETKNG
ncbi:MAG: homoserine kinase [Spirochaetia bacterium]|nr:homoserine kinase [Spirochaetia bacterium]